MLSGILQRIAAALVAADQKASGATGVGHGFAVKRYVHLETIDGNVVLQQLE